MTLDAPDSEAVRNSTGLSWLNDLLNQYKQPYDPTEQDAEIAKRWLDELRAVREPRLESLRRERDQQAERNDTRKALAKEKNGTWKEKEVKQKKVVGGRPTRVSISYIL